MDKIEEKLARMTMTDAQFYKDGLADGLETCTKKIKELEEKLSIAVEALKSINGMREKGCTQEGCTCVFDHAAITIAKIEGEG